MGRERHGPQRGTTGVEFLAPDERAFGGAPVVIDERSAADRPRFVDDRPPSRWSMGVIVLGVAALIGAGVVAASPWDDPQDAATPPTTTMAPPSPATAVERGVSDVEDRGPPGSPVPATGGPRPSARYSNVDRGTPWVVDVPDGYVAVDSFREPEATTPGWFQLWAADGAARTSERWFAVHVAVGPRPVLVAGAERVPFGDGSLLRWTSPDGVEHLQFTPSSGDEVRVTAYGWSPEHLLALARSMEVVEGRPSFTMPGPSPDVLRISRETTAFGMEQEYLGGDPWSSVEWRDADGDHLALTVAPAERDASTIGRFVVAAVEGTAMSGFDVRRDVGSLNATVGRLPGADDRFVARWAIGDTALSLTGTVSIDELLDLAETVHPATDREWRDVEYWVGSTRSTTSGGWQRVGGGVLESGGSWVVFENVRDERISVSIGALEATIDAPSGTFRAFATREGTLVVARLVETQDGLVLRASGDDGAVARTVAQELLALDGELIGAVFLETLGPIDAEIVGPDGRVARSISTATSATG